MNKKQQRRAEILGRLTAGAISKVDASNLLGLGRRQIDRLANEYRRNGLASVVHGNTGKAPVNKTTQSIRENITELADKDGKYHDLNTCHMADLLLENEDIKVGRSTLERLLRHAGLIHPGKRKPQVRRGRRERSAKEGMMLQIDGSSHDWLAGRGAKMALIGAIDDANGHIVYAHFRPSEDQAGYLMMLRAIAVSHGIPECLYHDRHTILRSPSAQSIDDELEDRVPQSQVQRVMSELGIVSIPAHSPQAKGRIERLWKTLQDRLIKEMTIAGISTISEANVFLEAFIPRYNARFGKKPADSDIAWVTIDPSMDMHYHFATSELRTVRRDYTISFGGKTYQILPDEKQHTLAGKRVDVRTSPEGEIKVYVGKDALSFKTLDSRPAIPAGEQPRSESKTSAGKRRKGWLFARTAA